MNCKGVIIKKDILIPYCLI